ncbi:hypothetical protein [Streptomyces chiangmaiensis]|uniref:Uncharacterized protein n=1 Tax=Streptomyces chiangmaiensis TaxID=766497 RepID=A0ABU7FR75_9ACTN|nr:hypothetical protein [Streptomyces chiangmaiensis]MED7826587.1 hypothetical protein [Streptomyces chiangmaiensis]
MAHLDAAVGAANAKVLLDPTASPAVVHSGNRVAGAVVASRRRLGIERDRRPLDARRWAEAAAEARGKVLKTGAEGVDAARRLNDETLDRARSVTVKLPGQIAGRVLRRRGDDQERDEGG